MTDNQKITAVFTSNEFNRLIVQPGEPINIVFAEDKKTPVSYWQKRGSRTRIIPAEHVQMIEMENES